MPNSSRKRRRSSLGHALFGRSQRGRVPLLAVHVVDGNEGGLATHRQADIAGDQFLVNALAQLVKPLPLFLRVGLGDARGLEDARDPHFVVKLHFAGADQAGDRRRRARFGSCRQRDVPFPRKQAGSGVKPDPSRAGQVNFRPRVQVGKILCRANRALQRLHVGFELNQVAGNKSRRQAQVAQGLNQQPAGIAAGAAGEFQGLFRSLHARLRPNQIADFALQPLIEVDEEVHRRRLGAGRW